MKKIIKIEILLIIIFLLIQAIWVNNSYASITSENYQYDNLSDGTISICGYTGNEETITVPSTIDGQNVTVIGLLAFSKNSTVKKIILPEGILKLDAYAFDSCPNLTTVKMPSTLNYISNIFKDACPKLTDYTIPSSLTLLSDGSYRKIVSMNTSGTYNYDKAKEIVDLVNEERAKANLSPLQIDDSLMQSAMQRSAELSIYWDHERPNGLSCFSVNKKINGENIGAGASSVTIIMDKWMNSPGHKAQIVNSKYNSIGVGYYNHNGLTYYVQLFSKSNSDNTNTLSGKKDVSNTIEVCMDEIRINPVIKGFKEDNVLSIGETLSPTSVRNKNAGYNSAQTIISVSDFTWSSSNTNVFTVDANGTVTAIGEGEAILTASIGDFTATYNITVKGAVPIENITLNKTNINLEEGETEKLIAEITPFDTTDNKTITWESSNTNAVTVDSNGNIRGVKMGEMAVITATTVNGKSAECYVIVTGFIPVSSVHLELRKDTLKVGEQTKLKKAIEPSDATYREILFESSNPNVATVDEKGNITAIGIGRCSISAKGYASKDKTIFSPETTVNIFVEKDSQDIVFTTISRTEVMEKEVMTFRSKTSFDSILNAEKFPILDANYIVELYDSSNNLKGNSTKLGSKNTIKIKDTEGAVVAEYMTIVKGDVTGNGYSRMYDAFQILKDSLFNGKLDEIDMLIRDYDGNGYVRMYDAFQFLKDSLFN